jgi:hypothetical protein
MVVTGVMQAISLTVMPVNSVTADVQAQMAAADLGLETVVVWVVITETGPKENTETGPKAITETGPKVNSNVQAISVDVQAEDMAVEDMAIISAAVVNIRDGPVVEGDLRVIMAVVQEMELLQLNRTNKIRF